MPLKSSERKLSFNTLTALSDDVLISRSISDPSSSSSVLPHDAVSDNKKKKKKKKNKKSILRNDSVSVSEVDAVDRTDGFRVDSCSYTIVETTPEVVVPEVSSEVPERKGGECSVRIVNHSPQLRQRNVNFVMNGGNVGSEAELEAAASAVTSLGSEESRNSNGGGEVGDKSLEGVRERTDEAESQLQEERRRSTVEMNGRKFEKEESLDWKKLMAEDPIRKSVLDFFLDCHLLLMNLWFKILYGLSAILDR